MLRVFCLALVLLLALSFTAPAMAQNAMKIGVANPGRIFNEMQETKDLQEAMKQQANELNNQGVAREEEIKGLQAAIKVLQAGSPQFNDKQQELLRKMIELDVWRRMTQAQIQNSQKLMTKNLYDKISKAVEAVAKEDGLDLVIAETNVDFPADLDSINTDQLRVLINQRNVLFNSGKQDINEKVITRLNAEFKSARK